MTLAQSIPLPRRPIAQPTEREANQWVRFAQSLRFAYHLNDTPGLDGRVCSSAFDLAHYVVATILGVTISEAERGLDLANMDDPTVDSDDEIRTAVLAQLDDHNRQWSRSCEAEIDDDLGVERTLFGTVDRGEFRVHRAIRWTTTNDTTNDSDPYAQHSLQLWLGTDSDRATVAMLVHVRESADGRDCELIDWGTGDFANLVASRYTIHRDFVTGVLSKDDHTKLIPTTSLDIDSLDK